MERKGSAVWTGSLKEGKGTVSVASGALKDASYSFGTRFENGVGTNPEELIGAAHASCFSMALSAELGKANLTPERIATTAIVTMEKTDAGMTVTKILLDTVGKVPGATAESFGAAALAAKAGCPISRLLKTAEISLSARLE